MQIIAPIHDAPVVAVSLSRRNLEHLLAALDTSLPGEPVLTRTCENGTKLTVIAQENDEHYEREERTPGPGYEGIV